MAVVCPLIQTTAAYTSWFCHIMIHEYTKGCENKLLRQLRFISVVRNSKKFSFCRAAGVRKLLTLGKRLAFKEQPLA